MSIHGSTNRNIILETLAQRHLDGIHCRLSAGEHQGRNNTRMESPFTLPIRIYYRPPDSLLIFLSVIHIGAVVCLMSLSAPLWSRVLLVLIVLCSYFIYTFEFLRARRRCMELILLPDNEWRVVDSTGDNRRWCQMALSTGAFVHPGLVVLKLRGPMGKYSFLLTGENVDIDTLRRLRVRLRYPG